MGDFRKLKVWDRSRALAVLVYRVTSRFPSEERFGLADQMRRAALSVSSNLAEGCGRRGDAELRRYVRISQGSLAELESLVLVVRDLGLPRDPESDPLLTEIGVIRGMLDRLHRGLAGRRGT